MSVAGITFEAHASLFELTLGTGEHITYRPDVSIRLQIDGRRIHVETHSANFFDEQFIKRMSTLMNNREFKSGNYLILITERDLTEYWGKQLTRYGKAREDVCDELWPIRRIRDGKRFALSGDYDFADFVSRLRNLKRRSESLGTEELAPPDKRSHLRLR